jgi:hypothetical protein
MTAGAKDPFRWEILISLRDGESLSRDFYVGVTEEGGSVRRNHPGEDHHSRDQDDRQTVGF